MSKAIKNSEEKFMQSETIIIKRSQISFAPYNPKHHTPEAIKRQQKNFREKGFLGGIVWNETTGNLVSGHKRVMAMDLIYKYDGTPEKDYNVKVEKVNYTDKEEKEQNIYMDARGSNTSQDLMLIGEILPEIDFEAAGLTANDLNMIETISPTFTIGESIEQNEDIDDIKTTLQSKKQAVKDAKKAQKQSVADNFEGDSYVIITFNDFESKAYFMERFGFEHNGKYIKGESFSDMIERID